MMMFRHAAAIVLLLLSQLSASTAVMCDEGTGLWKLELLASGCCSDRDAVDANAQASTADLASEEDCGGCSDTTLTGHCLLTERDNNSLDHQARPATTGIASIILPPLQVDRPVTAITSTVLPIALQSARTTVLRC